MSFKTKNIRAKRLSTGFARKAPAFSIIVARGKICKPLIKFLHGLARGEERAGSDVDLLVEMEERRSLLDLSHLLQDVEELLGCPVHVVEPEALHWAIRERILEEAVPL